MSDLSSNITSSTSNVNNKTVFRPPALVIGDIAIEKKAIEDDIRYLLQEFIKVYFYSCINFYFFMLFFFFFFFFFN